MPRRPTGKPTGRPPIPMLSVYGPYTVIAAAGKVGVRRTYRVRCTCGRESRKDISALTIARFHNQGGCSWCGQHKLSKLARNAAIVAAVEGGESCGSVGRRLGLSRQRVANIVDNYRKHEGTT